MIRKIGVLSISLLCLVGLISCEKDFNDVGSNVVNNSKFETGEIFLDIEIEPIDISETNTNELYKSVRADNIVLGSLSEYWLGVYKNDGYKTIKSSFVSQLSLSPDLKTKDTNTAIENGEVDSIFTLDKVILKLPYIATNEGKDSNGKTLYKLDSILGNKDIATSIKVYRNGTYLNVLDPDNPSKSNSFDSNQNYDEMEVLNENEEFSFTPNQKDTTFVITRNISNGNTFQDTIRLANKAPFLAIPLKKDLMKEIFWDKFDSNNFNSSEALNTYFRGLIVKNEGDDGTLVPFNLSGNVSSASLDFHYTVTTFEKEEGNINLVLKDTISNAYSFPLSGVRNSVYTTSDITSAPTGKFKIQGTAGTMARIKILNESKLEELRNNNWLINDASLTFYIDQTLNSNKNIIPQKLFIYQEKNSDGNDFSLTQISDAYVEAANFGGDLEITEEGKPEKYTFRITNYISNLLNRVEDVSNDPLVLKVFNPTDRPSNSTKVSTYNWNPRAITLLDGTESINGTKKAVLKISYSKEK